MPNDTSTVKTPANNKQFSAVCLRANGRHIRKTLSRVVRRCGAPSGSQVAAFAASNLHY